MNEVPEDLTDAMLDGSERMRVARPMRNPPGTGPRTGAIKVWRTSISDILRFARRVSPTLKSITVSDGKLQITATDDTVTVLELPPGPRGAPGAPGKDSTVPGPAGAPSTVPGPQGAPGKDSTVPGPQGAASTVPGPAGPSALVDLGEVTITQTANIALALGVRLLTIPVPGVKKGEHIVLTPLSIPVGYLIGVPAARDANLLDVSIYAPVLALGTSYTIRARVAALRSA